MTDPTYSTCTGCQLLAPENGSMDWLPFPLLCTPWLGPLGYTSTSQDGTRTIQFETNLRRQQAIIHHLVLQNYQKALCLRPPSWLYWYWYKGIAVHWKNIGKHGRRSSQRNECICPYDLGCTVYILVAKLNVSSSSSS